MPCYYLFKLNRNLSFQQLELYTDLYFIEKSITDDAMEKYWVYHGVKTCEVFLSLVAIVKVRFIMLNSLLSFFYVTGECHRFLH